MRWTRVWPLKGPLVLKIALYPDSGQYLFRPHCDIFGCILPQKQSVASWYWVRRWEGGELFGHFEVNVKAPGGKLSERAWYMSSIDGVSWL
jgi:hypothetical protein